MLRNIISITALLILSSCVDQYKDKNFTTREFSTKKITEKESDNTILVFIDDSFTGHKVYNEITNALQLAFLHYTETKNSSDKHYKISIEQINKDKSTRLYNMYKKYKHKNISSIISFLNENELNKISFFFRDINLYSINKFNNTSRNIKYLKNNIKNVLHEVVLLLKNSNKILFIDYDEKLKNKFDRTMADMNLYNDIMIDYIPFSSISTDKLKEIIRTQQIDSLIINTSVKDINRLITDLEFNKTIILLNPNDIEIANLPNIEDFYFTFVDLEMFKDFSNTYTKFFKQDPPSLYSYIAYKLTLNLLLNEKIDLNSIQKFAVYHKSGSMILSN